MARITFEIDEETKQKMKIRLAERGETFREVLEGFCKFYVAQSCEVFIAQAMEAEREGWRDEDKNVVSGV